MIEHPSKYLGLANNYEQKVGEAAGVELDLLRFQRDVRREMRRRRWRRLMARIRGFHAPVFHMRITFWRS